jgi:hypothetical protein
MSNRQWSNDSGSGEAALNVDKDSTQQLPEQRVDGRRVEKARHKFIVALLRWMLQCTCEWLQAPRAQLAFLCLINEENSCTQQWGESVG